MKISEKEATMECGNKLIRYFISPYCNSNDKEYQEMIDHIVRCEVCFKELVKLAPKYDPRVEE